MVIKSINSITLSAWLVIESVNYVYWLVIKFVVKSVITNINTCL